MGEMTDAKTDPLADIARRATEERWNVRRVVLKAASAGYERGKREGRHEERMKFLDEFHNCWTNVTSSAECERGADGMWHYIDCSALREAEALIATEDA